MKLVLFDFDGTLTKKDSFIPFLMFARSPSVFFFRMILLSPLIVAALVGIAERGKVKEKIFRTFFRGSTRNEMNALGEKFIGSRDNNFYRSEVMEKLKEYRASGWEVCVVSASIDCWVNVFCKRHRVAAICTTLEYDNDGIFSGYFSTPNCRGYEKVKRVKMQYDLALMDRIAAYGNSNDDLPMLEMAHDKYMI